MLCIGTIHSGTVKGFVPPASADDIITHTDLTPEPLAAVDNAYRLAATWWLPDWQILKSRAATNVRAAYAKAETLKATAVTMGYTKPALLQRFQPELLIRRQI